MRILVACEESQAVCLAFRAAGHEAYSCDLQACSGGHPEWHIIGDAIKEAYSGSYDMIIAHPPCTLLSKAGARWMYQGGKLNQQRLAQAKEAARFFRLLLNAPARFKAIENPEPLRVVGLPAATQTIQPYEFGHPYSKKTMLWLVGLPPLRPTEVVREYAPYLPSNTGGAARGQKATAGISGARARSKTFSGIAAAMAAQWSHPARFVQMPIQTQLFQPITAAMKAPNDYTDLLASEPTRHTAPPAEHGLRDLGLGVLLCLLLLSLLPSCAPARLPLGTVARPVGHDPRTKLVEPMPAKSVR